MAQYRLEVKAIKRAEGRSSVAAASYRAATALRDERLEMVFDYSRKQGVAFVGIMGPEGAPAAYADREQLWNAAEAADKRADSRPAREILISLPHELTDHQRHALVRAFLAESVIARGMIADYALHDPDAHGDARNHHAHILVTTRAVSPEGFGFKVAAWKSPALVQAWRQEWELVQNQHLRQHLGPDAPQVSSKSLAGQGRDREATIHLGPAASGMERRGEASDRGDINRRINRRNDHRREAPGQVRALEDQVAANEARAAFPIEAVIREFEAIQKSMVDQRAAWIGEMQKVLLPPSGITSRTVIDEVIGDAARARAAAARQLDRTQERIERGRQRRSTLLRWIRNPARMIWAAHAELNALERSRRAARLADAQWRVRRDWLESSAGRAYIADQLEPARQAREASVRTQRTLERKIRRADKRIEAMAQTRIKLLIAQTLGEGTLVTPVKMTQGVGQAVREVDRRTNAALSRYSPVAQQRALDKVMALARGRGQGLDR